MDILAYYASQSRFTDPGACAEHFQNAPKSVEGIVEFVQDRCLDFEERYKYPIQNERLLETNNRYADEIINKILKLKRRSAFTDERAIDEKTMVLTSQSACLTLSMLRYNGIPARKRVGFVAQAGIYKSYEIVEVAEGGAWKQLDPFGWGLEFIPAAKAWADYKAGKIAADQFVNVDLKGVTVLIANLILDLAALNKQELLTWDRFGWMNRPIADYSEKAWAILDGVAAVLAKADEDPEAVFAAYEAEEGLQVPEVIWCETQVCPPHKVTLR